MWFMWIASVLVSLSQVSAAPAPAAAAAGGVAPAPLPEVVAVATPRPPPRTLDRQGAELVWRSWLQSPESGNPNAPPRRITTKSLFITPLVCPKGQRLDRDSCVQVVTVNKDDHERKLLEQLNALFTSAPGADVLYDYGDEEPGPLQLSLPIGLEPQAQPLHAADPAAPGQLLNGFSDIDKKDDSKLYNDASIEAELELLKLQHSGMPHNDTFHDKANLLSLSDLNNYLPLPDKPKRDSTVVNATHTDPSTDISDEGQKELVFGQVNFDPYENYDITLPTTTLSDHETETATPTEITTKQNDAVTVTEIKEDHTYIGDTTVSQDETTPQPQEDIVSTDSQNKTENNKQIDTDTDKTKNFKVKQDEVKTKIHELKTDVDKTKLNPETDYSDIGEAIKLISRYAEVTTDDNYSKDQKKYASKEDGILGTRTKLQHRRNRTKPVEANKPSPFQRSAESENREKLPTHSFYPKNEPYYRYPWVQNSPTPPPNYPFRHLQDYWPGQAPIAGGVYNTPHENPRRHHHSFPHNYFRPHGGFSPYYDYSYAAQEGYQSEPVGRPSHRVLPRRTSLRSHNNQDQDLYSLLGLRHWFSSEGATKR